MSTAADDPAFSQHVTATDRLLPEDDTFASADEGFSLPHVLDGRYRLYATLGQGSVATTYRALDLQASRVVAVKVFAPGFGPNVSFRARFFEHAERLSALAHRGIVRVLNAGEADGQLYLVTEVAEGHTLRDLLRQRTRLPIYLVVRIGAQIAETLEYLHGHGIVHGDLRPENILLQEDGRVRLSDLDGGLLASARGVVPIESLTRRAAYLAPEQVRGDGVDARTDVYGLGVLLFEMLVGEPPAAPSPSSTAGGRRRPVAPPHIRGERPDVCWGLEYVIRQALAPESRERPPTVADLRRGLLRPPSQADLAAGMAEATWQFRAAALGRPLDGPPPTTRRVTQFPRRPPAWVWLGRALPIVAPLLGTAIVLFVLINAFNLMPTLVTPLQIVRLPELQGRSWTEAEEMGRAMGLDVVKARPEPCDDRGRDFVLRQEPGPGAISHRGAKVKLTTCSGLRVPSVVGQREEQARVVLAQRDWTVAEVRTVQRTDAPAGTIVAQEPSSDMILPEKRPLVLTVAQPPRP